MSYVGFLVKNFIHLTLHKKMRGSSNERFSKKGAENYWATARGSAEFVPPVRCLKFKEKYC